MSAQRNEPWPATDLAELKYGLAFGSSVEEIAKFLRRDVEEVRQKAASQKPRPADELQRS
jgi:hypothetical protein